MDSILLEGSKDSFAAEIPDKQAYTSALPVDKLVPVGIQAPVVQLADFDGTLAVDRLVFLAYTYFAAVGKPAGSADTLVVLPAY